MSKLSIYGKALAASVIAIGAVSSAYALPLFTIEPSSVTGGAPDPQTGDSLSGNAESFLQITSATTIAGHGFMRFTALNDGSDTVYFFAGPSTTTTIPMIFWAEYQYTTTLTSGTIGAPGSDYNITSLTFDFFGEKNDADTASDSVFKDANAADPTSAKVTQSGDTIKLGSGSLITGVAAFNLLAGSSFTPIMDMVLTDPAGLAFFVLPDPFYRFAFTSATNTASAFSSSEINATAKISGVGSVDFNDVPEPGSLALLGLGLVGLAAVRHRKASK